MDQVVFTLFGWLIGIDRIFLSLILVGLLFLMIRWWRGGRRLVAMAVMLLVVTVILPTGPKMMSFLENRFPVMANVPSDVKGIIILGGSFDLQASVARERVCYNMSAGRAIEFMQLALRYPQLPILFSGAGAVQNPLANESLNMKKLLESLNFDVSRVTFEDKSKTTLENARLSFDLIKPAPQDKWLLVTSAYHMPRSVGLFRAAGWNIVPYPVDYHAAPDISWWDLSLDINRRLMAWSTSIREIGGMLTNYLAGRTSEIISSP